MEVAATRTSQHLVKHDGKILNLKWYFSINSTSLMRGEITVEFREIMLSASFHDVY